MQVKTIRKNIEEKLNEWINSIDNDYLKSNLKDNIIVSGGCIASMLLKEKVNDYDVYIKDINILKELAIYYIKDIKGVEILDGRKKKDLIQEYGDSFEESNSKYAIALRTLKDNQIKIFTKGTGGFKVEQKPEEQKNSKYKPLFFSSNAISLSDDIQIILRFWGGVEEIHKNFDFVHSTNYFTFKDGVVNNVKALESLMAKQLKYQGSLYPLSSIIRMKKFIKRGFNISSGEILKIMYQISKLNLDDPDTLEDQVIGVDVVFLPKLIEFLLTKQTDNNSNNDIYSLDNLIEKLINSDEEEIN